MSVAEEVLGKTLALVGQRRRLPESTYRLQFHAGFTFRDAERIVPYLSALGITHCYASPYLRARPGSTHGYDIVDHNHLNPEIGTEADYDAWVAALHSHGMGQILDTVPNHMGVGTNDNAWWNDVLENGPASRHAVCFDIAWRDSPRPELHDKVLLPVLGEPYGVVLEKGELRLGLANGAFTVHYYGREFPVAPRAYAKILGHRLAELEHALDAGDPALIEYQSILTAVHNLPDRLDTDPARVAERQREKEVIKGRLAALAARSAPVQAFLDGNLAAFNGKAGDPRSFDLLDDLLEHQCYRLAYWRVAADEINYRRFFDINDLAALSMEHAEVFDAAHALVLRLLAEGKVDGLRIDHPDGLFDPVQYLRRLQENYVLACARQVCAAGPVAGAGTWEAVEPALRERLAVDGVGTASWPLYVVVEKILAVDEPLPETWPVHGTSGYDFVIRVNNLFVDPAGAAAFTRLYADWTGHASRYSEVVYHKKLLILQVALASELNMLAHQLDRLAQRSRLSRDFTLNTLRRGLREVIACFTVYRSYLSDRGVDDTDRRYVETAVRRARTRNPLMSRAVFAFIRGMLLLEYPESFSPEDQAEQRRFAGKFQQVTAPVTAKGVEDTAFYVYNRLASLNEVGGEPGRFGADPATLHGYNRDRQAKWPYALSPLSTHDTKRSEDVRARINVLSGMPDAWREGLERWARLNEPHLRKVDDESVPDANEQYLIYQTLVGAWPLEPCPAEEFTAFVGRIQAYLMKALHEAKVHTSWVNPNEEYDQAVSGFIASILDATLSAAFLDDFRAFQRRVSDYGMTNALAQTLLKITAPGVPDTYQGTELWDFSLVDPDNRRPVDYATRERLLRELQSARGDLRELARDLVAAKADGRIKLYVNYRALHCRREHPGLFSTGEYLPLEAAGPTALHLFAFARRHAGASALVAVPRLLARLAPDADALPSADVWQDTRLTLPGGVAGRWRNVFTGAVVAPVDREGSPSLSVGELFADFPVALLVNEPNA